MKYKKIIDALTKTNSFSANQGISSILWNPGYHNRVHKNPRH
jgi:hypothetical protein